MNLFVTDTNPSIAVQHLDDKRLRKMVLETGQIICTVCHLHKWFKTKIPYKPTHINHSVIRWANSNYGTITWCIRYFTSISSEYIHRYKKIHKTQKDLFILIDSLISEYFYSWQFQPDSFYNCAVNKKLGIDYTHIKPVAKAYQMYLNHRWNTDKVKPKWTKREKPEFYYESEFGYLIKSNLKQ